MPTEALVGQSVAVMPITLIAADPALQSDTIYAPYRDRQTTLLWADLQNRYVWICLLTTLGFGAIGWVDDWRKVVHRNPKGLSA